MSTRVRVVLTIALVLASVVVWNPDRVGSGPDGGMDPAQVVESGVAAVARLFESRQSGEMVEVAGDVEAVLPDDDEGSRHQRFIVRLESDQTLLVAHNLDLASRVPIGVGDRVRLRGEYEWNERGGVVHWTHHDPEGRREGGWIDFDGRRYR